ncbi:hypothetical protein H0I39_04430 [Ottowia beijingensis]|uniref:Uncharacterized protein n=1 Tax=Ottowia beijingensis TaxID=1207057 RepID=A0A853IKJ8_9BURK|nr:hypothetical protein [Ottowia beijingensis]NZA01203.1 hypothetical protein [Ottowia beijingensis]
MSAQNALASTSNASARRQAGAIRLQQGEQNPDGTGWGLAHMEARHGKEIRAAGFDSVEAFLIDAFHNMDGIWKPGATSQLIAVQSGRTGKVAFIQLEVDTQGSKDFYRVNSAFPANEKFVSRKEKREGWEPLWSRYPVPADASGASGFVGQSPNAGETAPTVSGQSDSASVPPAATDANTASPQAQFERLRAESKAENPGVAAFAKVAGASGESAADVYGRWHQVMGFNEALANDTGAQIAAKMAENLPRKPWGNDDAYPGANLPANNVPAAHAHKFSERAEAAKRSFDRDMDTRELMARDAENFGVDENAVAQTRATVREMRKKANDNMADGQRSSGMAWPGSCGLARAHG